MKMNEVGGSVGMALMMSITVLTSTARGQDPLVPSDMVYVGHGPAVMGLDKAKATESGRGLTAYDKRMKTPWSAEAFHDEGPAHRVFLDSFLIDKYEVANKDFGDFIKMSGHPAPAYWDDPRLNKPQQPVVGVNWYDAKAFCESRGKRLPTEAEWEKAARGPYGNLYPWGNDFDSAKANYNRHQDATSSVDSHPAGASYYGVFNMAGNVFEWVADWYDPNYYGTLQTMVNPTGPANAIWIGGTGTYVDRLTVGEKRVIRGGSWIAPEGNIRSTHRFWNHPLNNSYGVGLGFRCAQGAPPELEQRVRDSYITALVEMGRQRWGEAQQAVNRVLALDPKNVELLQLQPLIQQSMKRHE
jgi:formylglycine-generating enzyme required for sulfatase activity